jgi:hypothetical protein
MLDPVLQGLLTASMGAAIPLTQAAYSTLAPCGHLTVSLSD